MQPSYLFFQQRCDLKYIYNHPNQGLATFSVRADSKYFRPVGHMFSVTPTQLFRCSTHAVRGCAQICMDGHYCAQ